MKSLVSSIVALAALLPSLSAQTGIGVQLSAQTNIGVQPLRPNVLVIVLDDVGVEKLASFTPPPTPPTPQLTQIANAGVRFTNNYAQPLCAPTRATIMTGRYAFRTGMGTNAYPLPLSEITLAELLRDGFPAQPQQYRLGAFGKWHLTNDHNAMHPILQGFQVFSGTLAGAATHYNWDRVDANSAGSTITHIGSSQGPFDETTFTASVVRQQALSWITAQPQPWFAYVAFHPPHSPFQVPPLTTVSTATAYTITSLGYVPGVDLTGTADAHLAYDWLIEAVDTEVGRLLAGIGPTQLARTTIFIVSDNGTPDDVIQPPYDPLHAKGTVYQQGTWTPMICAGFDVSTAGLACSAEINTVDIWRTVAEVTGAQIPAGVVLDSISFKNLLTNPSVPGSRGKAFVQLFSPCQTYVPDPNHPPPLVVSHQRAMNDGAYKYLRLGTSAPSEEAYDLVNDPLETNDLWPILSTLPPAVQARILGLKSSLINLSGF